jgi:hypothetical protein
MGGWRKLHYEEIPIDTIEAYITKARNKKLKKNFSLKYRRCHVRDPVITGRRIFILSMKFHRFHKRRAVT